MRFFFIDLENVRSNGLEGVLSLEAEDLVFIFYSENANNLTIPTLENINNSKATVKFINTNFVGSNAMDFQIVSLLGAMIERHKQGFFSIISHDNGFKSALTFCERYFNDYPISVGKFDNIISAIAYDIKHPIGGKEQGGGAIKKKKKTGSESGKKKNTDEKAVIMGRKESPEEEKASDDGKPADKERGEVRDNKSAAAQERTVDTEKKEGRGRRRRKQNQPQDRTQENDANARESRQAVSAGPDMQYIYDYLKDMLSVKTIDVYASKIHEALLVANTKDELHKFFKNKCGEDEGEALFKLLHGDFENMKKLARR